jgi:hypothetical protein
MTMKRKKKFHIPQNCFKENTDVNNSADLTLLLSTLRFWGVSAIPKSVVTYTVWHKPVEVIDAFVEFEHELRYVKFLRALCNGTDKCLCTSWEAAWKNYCSRLSGHTGADRVAELCVFHYEYRDGVVWDETTCTLAATAGELDVLRFLHEHGCPWDAECCAKAAESGSLECLQYAHENDCPWSTATCSSAAGSKRRVGFECLKYAHTHGCPWDAKTCECAVASNNLECLRYAHENGCPWGPKAYKTALYGSSCYNYLRDNDCPEGDGGCIAAARAGDLPRVRLLHESGCVLSECISKAAVEGDSPEVLRYLHKHGCPWPANICSIAAKLHYLDCLQYLRENGATCEGEAIIAAAGNLSSIKCFSYLVDAGCALDKACKYAALCGNSAALLYALENGCTGSMSLATYAAWCGSLACLKYAHEHGSSWDEGTCAVAARQSTRSRREKLACLQYAHEHGCPWDAATCTGAAQSGDIECLQYAHEHGCPWDESTCTDAAHTSNLACLQYAHEHGCPWTAAAIVAAVWSGSITCFTYLHEHGCPWPEPAEYEGLTKSVRNRKCLEYVAEHPEQRPAVVPVPPANCAGCTCISAAAAIDHAAPVAEPVPAVEVIEQSVPSQEAADDESWQVVGRRGRVVRSKVALRQELTVPTASAPVTVTVTEKAQAAGNVSIASTTALIPTGNDATPRPPEAAEALQGVTEACEQEQAAEAGEDATWTVVASRRKRGSVGRA